ncbi:MAG: hypothetical protein WCH39_22795, partial [Schlesneria sp.]
CHAQIEEPNLRVNFDVLALGVDSTLVDDFSVAAVNVEQPKYWIGLLCIELSDALRSQLNLEANIGLLVDAVTDDSPARKQGLERNDILLSARLAAEPPEKESRKFAQVADLVKIVQEAESKPVQFEVLRRGMRKTIEVTPVERPMQDHARLQGNLVDYTTRLTHSFSPDGKDFRMFIAGPMYESAGKSPPLPEGVSMEFHQVVGEREKITVKKGDQKWETTVDEAAKLPEEIRLVVLQQLAARRSGPVPHVAVLPPTLTPPPSPHLGLVPPGVAVQQRADQNGLPGAKSPMGWVDTKVNVPVAKVVLFSTTDLPENVTVSIVRKGTDPARITVKKDEQSWEVTEKELSKLPEDVRKLVAPMIPNQMKSARVEYTPHTYTVKKYGVVNDADAGGRAVIKSTSADELNPVAAKAAEVQRQTAVLNQQNSELVSRILAREAALDKQVKELQDKLQSLNELKTLNEKIEKLQQSLDKALPK